MRTRSPLRQPATSVRKTARISRKPLLLPCSILPAALQWSRHVPFTRKTISFSMDSRQAGESAILFSTMLYATLKISLAPEPVDVRFDIADYVTWTCIELLSLITVSVLYMLWTHTTISEPQTDVQNPATSPAISPLERTSFDGAGRTASQRTPMLRLPERSKVDFGFLFMSVPKNYRDSLDDGVLTGLLFGPLIATSLLWISLRSASDPTLAANPLPSAWRVEPPASLAGGLDAYSVTEAIILSRFSVVDLATLCSFIHLLHICASWWLESRFRVDGSPSADGERRSVPRSEGRRSWYYIVFTFMVSLFTFSVRVASPYMGCGIWQNLNILEAVVASLFFQFAQYIVLRLAHRGFTLGEIGLVCFGGTALLMELLNITIARIWPVTTAFIKTYRLPTPLLVFQIALVGGSFLVGFLLAPFLVLSRHIARRPVRRLRHPEEKNRQRRFLALGFYVGALLIVFGLIGIWARWCLGKRDPWLWAFFYLLEGRRPWSRPALLAYWGALGSLSVAGWNRQLARSRRYRNMNEALVVPSSGQSDMAPPSTGAGAPGTTSPNEPIPSVAPSLNQIGLFPNVAHLTQLPNGASSVATDILDAADKHVPTLRLNARRKFFHALAVVMFVPGIAYDPAFTHLAFNVAFALFIFAEYVRYFALYPFGASVHLFMNEFLDSKDSGTAILSHFYLLTGCANALWFEAPSQLISYTGVLVLGIGDALASIVGKRIGIHRWSPLTPKTTEGTAAFALSVVLAAWMLRLCGIAESFSTLRYGVITAISAVLEALSDQNDNLTLPLYMWSVLVLGDV
ncbi:hypothetical protein BD626DRAFT_490049 [Schizophyllum amplum]|uniref:dolichol kinase n=1 Tax=Schizophyllum amplum TaxID=97359 RepID=A0A550CJ47_9AGAR|nr:hypothetical protein BD626DRAFT_490049 [Auriculariopsis ampla]